MLPVEIMELQPGIGGHSLSETIPNFNPGHREPTKKLTFFIFSEIVFLIHFLRVDKASVNASSAMRHSWKTEFQIFVSSFDTIL